jgi:hypothetical protein
MEVRVHRFLTSMQDGAECPDSFTSGEIATGTNWIEDWMEPTPYLDTLEVRNVSYLRPEPKHNSSVMGSAKLSRNEHKIQ